MTTVSCIVVTTLVVVSLANLILLVHVIMQSMVKCETKRTPVKKTPKVIKREDTFVGTKTLRSNYKFVAALVVLFGEEDNFELVCGVAIISKKWVLTAAHCVEPILDEPRDKVKISSNTNKAKHGVWYDIDKMMVHDKYKTVPLSANVALISVRQVFKEKEVTFALLPSRSYKYLANSTGIAVGWTGTEVLSREVKLLSHRNCHSAYLDHRISDVVFCVERKSCLFDYGGFLIQKDLLVGVVSFGVGCGMKPVVFTKVALFEEWFKREKVTATFKD